MLVYFDSFLRYVDAMLHYVDAILLYVGAICENSEVLYHKKRVLVEDI